MVLQETTSKGFYSCFEGGFGVDIAWQVQSWRDWVTVALFFRSLGYDL